MKSVPTSLVVLCLIVGLFGGCGCSGGGGGGGGSGSSTGSSSGGGGLPSGTSAPFVPPAPAGAAKYFVSGTGSDASDGLTAGTAWRTLQKAADTVVAGDIVEVLDGHYARFTLDSKVGAAGSPIVFRAQGTGAVIDGGTSSSTSPDRRDAIKIVSCERVTVHGLRTQGAFRAGCRISDSLFVTVQAGVFADGGTWGIFTDYSDDVSLLGNECRGSGNEHGIYHSNSGDRAIIRGNWCHDNHASGIQINADPRQQDGSLGTRGDGICEACVVERNLCTGNGAAGGAALNFASIRSCEVRNNVLAGNLGQSGIVLWDDDNVSGGAGAGFGSKDNHVESNTVVFEAGQGRFCLAMRNGSTGNVIRNNVFRGGARGAISFTTDCLAGTVERNDVLASASGWPLFEDDGAGTTTDHAGWVALTGQGASDQVAAPAFTDAAGGDFSLASGSPGRDQGLAGTGVGEDYQGAARPGAGVDVGAYER